VLEVARIYRFLKGSGLPLRIPVIEMVEVGAGGGSIARLDALKRIAVGPDSAGSQPGPVCYGRGGSEPTVTDADLVLGRIDPGLFSGGRIALNGVAAERAVLERIGAPLNLATNHAALGISEMVDENMANAARVHAIERGKDLRTRTLIAFGGAAPLHAARVAEKLGIGRVLVLIRPKGRQTVPARDAIWSGTTGRRRLRRSICARSATCHRRRARRADHRRGGTARLWRGYRRARATGPD
jgi:N-methylhydantoinase A